MIEQILYQILGVTMIVFTIVFLWWAHVFGKETKRMWEEASRRKKKLDDITRTEPPVATREFNPGTWIGTGDDTK